MSETRAGRLRVVILVLYATQLLLALTILGLNTYGIEYAPFYALVYSLVVTLCTVFVCIYLIASHSLGTRWYRPRLALGLHICLLIFWIVGLGFVASLVKHWRQLETSKSDDEYTSTGFEIRKRDTKNDNTVAGTLLASALLASLEVILWITSTGILIFASRELHCQSIASVCVEAPSSPRMGPWDQHAVEAPRDGPRPMLPESDTDEPSLYPSPLVVAPGNAQQDTRTIHRGSDPYVGDMVMCRDYVRAYSPR